MTQLPTITEAARQIEAGQLKPTELLERCLERIDRYEERVSAWVTLDRQGAMQTAQKMERELTEGRYRGPLHGIPLGIKDIVDVQGLATTAGSPLRLDAVAAADAPLVASLRGAGAVIVGKTVTVEFACFDPSPTKNPWDPELQHTPGGSSSGSAVAVALGMCLGAIGTQTGGSLVRPSSYCGISTIRPTFGRVDCRGIVPVSYHLDQPGPMTRTVDDLELMLPYLPHPLQIGRMADQQPSEPPEAVNEPRLGFVEQFFMDEADQPIRQATKAALAKLREQGARIEPVGLPDGVDMEEILAMHGRIMAVEAAEYHRETFAAHRESYGPMITGLLDEGLATRAVDYAAALAHWRELRHRVGPLFEHVDALIMPATDTTAPATLKTTGDKKFQAPWSYAGVPVVSIPCGLASDRMPAALQLVGPHHSEQHILAIARWCQQHLAFDAVPPLLG